MNTDIAQTTLAEYIELLQKPDTQDDAVNKLIGIAIHSNASRRPTEKIAVRSLLGSTLEKSLINILPQVTPLVRRKLIFILGEMGGRCQEETEPEIVQILEQVGEEDTNADIRAAAVDALGKLGGRRAVKALETISQQDSATSVRARAMFARLHLAPPSSQEVKNLSSARQFLHTMTQIDNQDIQTLARELSLRQKDNRPL